MMRDTSSLEDLMNERTMHAMLTDIGYTEDESGAWLESGFVVIDLSTVPTQTLFSLLSSEPIDLLALECDWPKYKRTPPGRHRERVLIDLFTGSILTPPELSSVGIWGNEGMPANTSPMEKTPVRFSRARFNKVPYYLAETAAEYMDLAATFQAEDEKGRRRTLFRGQTRDYSVHRHPTVSKFLFGMTNQQEVSVPTAAFRASFDYAACEPYVRNMLFDIESRLGGNDYRWCWVEDRYEEVRISPGSTIGKGNSIGVAAVAQHYGVPTYGLDVTASPEMAWWFATHNFESTQGVARYRLHTWQALNQEEWPVVYIFRTPHYVVLSELGLPRCERPPAQKAAFVFGGWGPHGNLCAADIVAAVVLSPEVGVKRMPVEAVFPSPRSDPMYNELMTMRNAVPRDELFYTKTGLQHVFDIHYEECEA